MNAGLLFVVLQFKLFAHQLRPLQPSLGFFTLSSIQLITFATTAGYLHARYMKDETLNLTIASIFLFLLFGDSFLLTMCHLHSRSLVLYRSLFSLMARVVAIDGKMADGVYNKHTVSLLRKELSHSDFLVGQFASYTLGAPFTYTSLLKYHFWWGLLVVSIHLLRYNRTGYSNNPFGTLLFF